MRTGDRPFERIEDVISHDEMLSLSSSYEKVAGYDKATIEAKDVAPA